VAFLDAIAFKGFRRCVQAAKQRAVRLSLACISGKYLWALPTPTTFEKVDQIFIIFKFNFHLNIKNRTVSIKYKNPQKI